MSETPERPLAPQRSPAVTPFLLLIVALSVSIFVGDLLVPAVVPSVPYAVIVLSAWWLPWRHAPLFLAFGLSILLLAGYALSPAFDDRAVDTIDAAISLAAIWIVAALAYRFKVAAIHAASGAERMRAVFEASVDPIITIDKAGAILTFNPAAERVFGYVSREVVGANVRVLMPSPFREEHDGYLANYIRTGQRKIIGIGREVVGQRKDGSTFPLRLAVAEASTREGRYFVGTIQDLSEQKANERALRESEARLRAIVDSAVDPIIVIDELGTVEAFNRAGESVLGYAAHEVIGRNVRMLMPSPDRERHDGYLHNYMSTGHARIIGIGREVSAQHKDGRLIPVRLAIAEASAGGKRRFVGMLHDLIDQKEAQKRLLDERNFVAAILDTTDALVIVADRASGIVRINRAAATLSGSSTDDLVGRPVWSLFDEAERQAVKVAVQGIAPGEPVRGEHNILARGLGTRILEWAGSGMWGEDGALQFLVLTGIDVTERRRAQTDLGVRERELSEVQAQLYRASRLGDLGEMATAIAHELNQPLTAVLNYVQTGKDLLAATATAVPPKVIEFMEKAGVQADRAGKIIRRLRQLYERGESEMVSTDLNGLVKESLALALLGASEKGVKVQLDLAADLPPVAIDRIQVQQVIFNLVRNAIEALEKSERRDLRIATKRSNGSIEVAVQDSGPGLPEEISRQLFEPFHTTKATGMGLGLSICRSIVESHGGRIAATSKPGEGARFAFTLPLDVQEQSIDA